VVSYEGRFFYHLTVRLGIQLQEGRYISDRSLKSSQLPV
jgi:hypothetical protein